MKDITSAIFFPGILQRFRIFFCNVAINLQDQDVQYNSEKWTAFS